MFYRSLAESLSEPANYPVIRQGLIIGVGLTLILSGIFFSNDSGADTTENTVAQVQPLPNAVHVEPTDSTIVIPDEAVALEAAAAHVYDVRRDTVLYASNERDILPLASITKLMTTLLVAELTSAGEVITVSEESVAQYGNSGLRVGERITAENLAAYALLSSSNDAAYALAASIGDDLLPGEGSAAFVDAMNVRAGELGLTDTSFQNPTGLDVSTVESGANGSARDVSRLLAYLLEHYPDILSATTLTETRVYNEAGDYHSAANTNRIVNDIPNLLGSKTGFTDLAGGNLTVAFNAGLNRPIVITVLGSSFTGRFDDMESLVAATQGLWEIEADE